MLPGETGRFIAKFARPTEESLVPDFRFLIRRSG